MKKRNCLAVQQPLVASQKFQRLHVLLNHLSCTPLAEVASPFEHHNCLGAGNQASNFFMSHMLQHTRDIISMATTTAETQNSSKNPSTISVTVAAIPKKKQQHANNSNLNVSPNDCGEDSYFIYHHTANEEKKSPDLALLASFGVADGVGGYAELGIDPSLMARQLMSNAQDLLASASTIKSAKSSEHGDPLDILREAYYTIIDKRQVAAGGTTACLVSLYKINNSSAKQRLTITDCDEEGEKPLLPTSSSEYILRAANLGDSGFMVIRLDKSEQRAQIIHKSSEQQYAFNTPFQLSVIAEQSADPKRKHKKLSNASNVIHNEPDDAHVESLQVQKNDVIILGTDGLFDNLFDEHVLQLTKKIYFLQKSNNTEENKEQQLALLLVETANKISKQENVVTPFAQNFTKAMRMTYRGGKPDDITVIVAKV